MKCVVTKWNEKEGNELIANGLIRVNSNKPEFGSLMLMSTVVTLSNGFLNKRNKVGFIVGSIEDLEATIAEYKLREGSDYSVAVAPHRIVTLEKLESELGEELGYREKINPTTGEVLKKNGETIMWKTEVVPEGSDITDRLIQHDTDAVTAVDPAIADFKEAADTKK
jgi:hypothetical protein